MIIMLLLIPVLCISSALYIESLVEIVIGNSYNTLMLIPSLCVSILVISILISVLINGDKKNVFIYNIEKNKSSINGYISFIYLFLFAIAIIINNIINKIDIISLLISIMVVIMYLYITVVYFAIKENITLKVKDIYEFENDIKELILTDDKNEYTYFTKEQKEYVIGKKYDFKINKKLQTLKRIK